jgi:hypothetical protein
LRARARALAPSADACRPGGFLILGAYLSLSWQLDLMPASYYDNKGATTLGEAFLAVNWLHVLLQLMITDGIQWFMHLGEHKVGAARCGAVAR